MSSGRAVFEWLQGKQCLSAFPTAYGEFLKQFV
jgi:hypothetical protein